MDNEQQLQNALLLTVTAFVKKYGAEGIYSFTKEEIDSVLNDEYTSSYIDLDYNEELKISVKKATPEEMADETV